MAIQIPIAVVAGVLKGLYHAYKLRKAKKAAEAAKRAAEAAKRAKQAAKDKNCTGCVNIGKNVDAVKKLTQQQLKAIRSLEKQIAKHKKKIQEFKDNPTVRPGMEKMPKEAIRKQQLKRIKHLETEIRTFKDNIEKIKRGEIGS